MTRRSAQFLDGLTILALSIAILIFVTGGGDIVIGDATIHAGRVGNPLAVALIAAAVARLRGHDDVFARIGRGWHRHRPRVADFLARFRGYGSAGVFVLLAVWGLDRGLAVPVFVEGDGIGYYAYLRSAAIDHDLDFLNEFRDFDPNQTWVDRRLKNGKTDNPFALGPALLWAPGFSIAWLTTTAANTFGAEIARDGYSPPFVVAAALTTWLLGVVAMVLLYRLLARVHSQKVALVASVATVLASPLAYYLHYAPFYSHVQSFFAVVLLLWLWMRTTARDRARDWLAFGLAAGLVAITRWQDAVFWVVPAAQLVIGFRQRARAEGSRVALVETLKRAAWLGLATSVVLLPQMLALHAVYGAWLQIPQGDSFMTRLPIYLWPTLTSWFHGLYSWTPLLLPATLGLVWAAASKRPWTRVMLVAFALQLYANGCVAQWWAGAAFGARRFSSSVPLFAFGLAELLRRTHGHPRWRILLGVVIGSAIVWNLFLAHLWLMSEIPHDEALDPRLPLRLLWDRIRELDFRFLSNHDSYATQLAWRLWGPFGDRVLLITSAAALYALSVRRHRLARTSS